MAASRGFGSVVLELSARVWIFILGVDSAKYFDSASTARYLNIWIRLRRIRVDLAWIVDLDSAGAGFGFGGDSAMADLDSAARAWIWHGLNSPSIVFGFGIDVLLFSPYCADRLCVCRVLGEPWRY